MTDLALRRLGIRIRPPSKEVLFRVLTAIAALLWILRCVLRMLLGGGPWYLLGVAVWLVVYVRARHELRLLLAGRRVRPVTRGEWRWLAFAYLILALVWATFPLRGK